MACYHPLPAYRKPGGGVAFDSKEGFYDMPLRLKCGQCLGCRIERTSGWAIRSVHEAQMHEQNSFLTLTYSDENMPEDRGLVIEHWQNFCKKVRHHYGPFRYLHCGEYSEAPEFRPHYHALIFGHSWGKERQLLQQEPGKFPMYVAPALKLLWEHGHHAIGEMNYQTAAYVAGYCLKKVTGEYGERQWERVDAETGEWWEVAPEYATMSRRPGLGSKWLDKYVSDVYPSDECIVDGKKLRPPVYYDNRLKQMDPKLHAQVEEQRKKHVRGSEEDRTYQRLRDREEVAKAKRGLKKRT